MLAVIARWRLWAIVLFLLAGVAQARMPPTPIFRFAFDVSRANDELDEQITIPEYRSYIFCIQFDYYNEVDLHRVANLVGIGIHTALHGVPLPLYIKLVKLGDDASEQLIYEQTRVTEGSWRSGPSPDRKFVGYFARPIVTIDLQPGLYRVELKTIQPTEEFAGTPSYLIVDYHPELVLIPNDL